MSPLIGLKMAQGKAGLVRMSEPLQARWSVWPPGGAAAEGRFLDVVLPLQEHRACAHDGESGWGKLCAK